MPMFEITPTFPPTQEAIPSQSTRRKTPGHRRLRTIALMRAVSNVSTSCSGNSTVPSTKVPSSSISARNLSPSPSLSCSATLTPGTSTWTSRPPSFFPSAALDHAFAGISAGAVATVCMNPLDLIKTQFQVDTTSRRNLAPHNPSLTKKLLGAQVAKDMIGALKRIVKQDGWLGLYRGLSPNVVGNSASWGFYFLWYTLIKEHMAKSMSSSVASTGSSDGRTTANAEMKRLSAGQHLLAASESGAITALLTNPIWVIKTRMFTTTKDGGPAATAAAPASCVHCQGQMPATATAARLTTVSTTTKREAVSSSSLPRTAGSEDSPYRSLRSSLVHIYRTEGMRGLYKGTGLALFGVSNGAIQFMAYEQLKRYRSNVALKKSRGHISDSDMGSEGQVKLTNTEYTVISGLAKLVAIGLTYPYQVVRSRIQNHATAHIYSSVSRCIQLTYRQEGLGAFYKGMSANLVRILPATCVTFVVYENVSWGLKRAGAKRAEAKQSLWGSLASARKHDGQTTRPFH